MTTVASSLQLAQVVSIDPVVVRLDGSSVEMSPYADHTSGVASGDEVVIGFDAQGRVFIMSTLGGSSQLATTPTYVPAGSVNREAILADAIDRTKIAQGEVVNALLAVDAVRADNLAPDSVTAKNIVADSIQGYHVVAKSISADALVAYSLTADEIATDTIVARVIAAGTITADEIAAGTITANEISAGTITADELEATFTLRVGQSIQSGNYNGSGPGSPGTAGFYMDQTGYAEFDDGFFRGDISGATGTFTGSLEAGSIDIPDAASTGLHVDTAGDLWSGATLANKASAPFFVDSATGDVTLNDATVDGNITMSSSGVIRTVASGHRAELNPSTADTFSTAGLSLYSTTANTPGKIGGTDLNYLYIYPSADTSWTTNRPYIRLHNSAGVDAAHFYSAANWTVSHPDGAMGSVNGNFNGDLYIGGDLESAQDTTLGGELLFDDTNAIIRAATGYIQLKNTTGGATHQYFDAGSTSGNHYFRRGSTLGVTIAGGAITCATITCNEIYGDVSSAGDPSFTNSTDQNTGLFFPDSTDVGLSANGEQCFIGIESTNNNSGPTGNGWVAINNYCGGDTTGQVCRIATTTVGGISSKRLFYDSSHAALKSGVQDFALTDDEWDRLSPTSFIPNSAYILPDGTHWMQPPAQEKEKYGWEMPEGAVLQRRAGFIWEEVAEVNLHLITEHSIDYDAVAAASVAEIKSLRQRVAALEKASLTSR